MRGVEVSEVEPPPGLLLRMSWMPAHIDVPMRKARATLRRFRNGVVPTLIAILAALSTRDALTSAQLIFVEASAVATPLLAWSWIVERGPGHGAKYALTLAFDFVGAIFAVFALVFFMGSFGGDASFKFRLATTVASLAVLISLFAAPTPPPPMAPTEDASTSDAEAAGEEP